MKKAILIALLSLTAVPVTVADAETGPVNLLINGGPENSGLDISLSSDGRTYEILSTVSLEVGGDLCSHPEELPNELDCKAAAIAGFEVNSGGGTDFVFFSSDIPIPVTIRGGPGHDRLTGGGASDKIVGGPDDDTLIGRRGADWMLGGSGRDRLVGGAGDDMLRGGPEKDKLIGGPGENVLIQ